MGELRRLSRFVESLCREGGAGKNTAMNIGLAMEEAVANIIFYAYPKNTEGEIIISACLDNGVLSFRITDTGIPFDPTDKKEADIDLPAEQRRIGGLGIHIVRKIMDTVSYMRTDGKNILTLGKRIS